MKLPPSLSELQLVNFNSIISWSIFSNLKNLSKLRLSQSQLQEIDLSGLEELRALSVTKCELLQRSFIPASLKKLKELWLSECPKLVEIEGLEALEFLEEMNVQYYGFVERLYDLSNSKLLKLLVISNCYELRTVEGLNGLESLNALLVYECSSLEKLIIPSKVEKLTHLEVSGCEKLIEIPGLVASESLETLTIKKCPISKICELSNLQLKSLSIVGCHEQQSIDGVDELDFLCDFYVSSCRKLEALLDESNTKLSDECLITIRKCRKLQSHGYPNVNGLPYRDYKDMIIATTNSPTGSLPLETSDEVSIFFFTSRRLWLLCFGQIIFPLSLRTSSLSLPDVAHYAPCSPSMSSSTNLHTESGLKSLDEFLSGKTYIFARGFEAWAGFRLLDNEILILKNDGSVQGISLTFEEGGNVHFTCEALSKKSNLRYLRLDGANSENLISNSSRLPLEEGNTAREPENLLPNLKWLNWHASHFIPELRNMDMKELLILDLSRSPVTQNPHAWKQIMEASLKSSPSTGLEILIMEDCTRSPALWEFISQLESLKSLNLRNCKGVRLSILQLSGKEFLRELLIDGTDVKKIDIENDPLENLEVLSARDCESLGDISPLGHLTKLKSLALDGAKIDWVPETFVFPPNLERLSLRKCGKLFELPRSICTLKQLEEMDLSETGITQLPESVEGLSNLKTLKMERTPLEKFPKDIGKLEKLREIDFFGCTNLEAQDSCDISGLSSLRILRLSSSIVAGLPQGICDLPCLRTLDVRKCERLQALPELPSSLVTLCGGFKIMEASKLTNLTNLKELCLSDDEQPEAGSSSWSPNIEWITRLPSLETLELSLPNVTNLPGDFRALTRLRELTLSYMEELVLTQLPSPSSLWTLRLKRCKIPEPNFSVLIYLSELKLEDCDLAKIDGLKYLQSLEVLKISPRSRITDLDELKGLPCLRKVKVFPFDAASLSELLERGCEVDTCIRPSSRSVAG
ncbi:disease resistance protein RPP5-like [Eucalyptus grandis]|uniref:disease resistance protein RPP5-like n=1 Tax=Eucalyptus grandis TaxID=71139 RepID=UPI00192EAE8D|nr:disease resistance protein RPP5-like [Eucalyptus grandis]